MSRPYHRHTAHRGSSDGHATFVLIVLLICLEWAHKDFVLEAERLAIIVMLMMAGLVAATALFRLVMRITKRRQLHNSDIAAIDQMTGLEFELYVANLLKAQGYKNVKLTEKYDLGIDIIAENDGIRWGIQVKRYTGLVGAEAVRQAVTALKRYRCDRAMVVSNSNISRIAKELAKSNDCILIGRSELLQWIAEEQIRMPKHAHIFT